VNYLHLLDASADLELQTVSESESPDPAECLQMVLLACGLICNPQDIAILREGKDMGRQIVFKISNTWIIRLFELYDGYRQPAAFISSVLTAGARRRSVRAHPVPQRRPENLH
jgi:hypothetical protein